MLIEQANVVDAQEILALQKLAYQSEATIYNDYTLPPLMEHWMRSAPSLQDRHF